jgi:hypothetical protein
MTIDFVKQFLERFGKRAREFAHRLSAATIGRLCSRVNNLKAILASIAVKEENCSSVFALLRRNCSPANLSPLLFVFITVVSAGDGRKIGTLIDGTLD